MTATATLTGRFATFSGEPVEGHVTIEPSVREITDSATKTIYACAPRSVPLDSSGAFSRVLIATDAPTLDRSFTYAVTLPGRPPLRGIHLPAGTVVDISDVLAPSL